MNDFNVMQVNLILVTKTEYNFGWNLLLFSLNTLIVD